MLIFFLVGFILAKDANLIELEIAQLEHLIQLQNEKLHYLKELREIVTVQQQPIPEIDQSTLQEVVQKKPYKQQNNNKELANKERSFTNRMLKKHHFNIPKPAFDASIIQTFQYKSSTTDNSYTQMLYVITTNQAVELYDLANQLIVTAELDFQPEFVSVSNRADDPILALANSNGQFSLLKIENARVPVDSSEKPKTKLVIQLNKELEFSVNSQNLTSIVYAMVKGVKYILFSSYEGSIFVYNRNGTLVGEKNLNTPIISLIRSYPNMLYITNQGFGFINPINLEIVQPICENLPFQIVHLTVDIQQTNIVYALSDQGEVYVFEIKQNEQCKMKLKLVNNNQEQIQQDNTKLYSLRHYLIAYDPNTKHSILYNTTDVLTEVDYEQPISLDYFKNIRGEQVMIQPIKGNGASHFLLTREIQQDHELISYYEITMPQKKEADIFSNFRFPIIIIAIVIVLLYQFWFKGKKKEKKGKKKVTNEEEEELEQMINHVKKPQTGPGGPGRSPTRTEVQNGQKQVRFDENLRRVDKFKEQLDNLDQKTKLLNDRVGVQNTIEAQRQKLAQQALLQKNKYV